MTFAPEIKKRLRFALPPVIGACVFGYFVYHAVEGDRGIMAWLRIGRELSESQTMLADVTAERQTMEHRVALLSSSSLDPDLLDERARAMLNVAEPDDRLVILSKAPVLAPAASPASEGN